MENARHTMLLVDDTEINLDILEGIFEADFIILKALNGKQALKVLKSQKVDIVILDVVMPEMDSRHQRSRGVTLAIPCMAMTSALVRPFSTWSRAAATFVSPTYTV